MQILVIGERAPVDDIAAAVTGKAVVWPFDDAISALEHLRARPEIDVPLLLLHAESVDVSSSLATLYAEPRLADALNIVLTEQREHHDLAGAIDSGLLQALVMIPTARETLAWFITTDIAEWMERRGLDPIAVVPAEGGPRDAPQSANLLQMLEMSEDELTKIFIDGIDEALAPRPRIHLPAGVRLTRQDHGVEGVFILVDGRVALTRATSTGNLLLHHGSTGRVVGLLSLARQKHAYFTSTTTTPCEVILLSIEQLEHAMLLKPELSAGLAVSTIRVLTQRLVHSEELRIERNELTVKLQREQERLMATLEELQQTRQELVSKARFATLGELSAGVAHELNNPVAALRTAADYLKADVEKLLLSHPDGERLAAVGKGVMERPPMSTSQERAARRELERVTGDPELAFRLVAAGVTDAALTGSLSTDDVSAVEAAASIAMAARNIGTASHRIQDLVRSLRSHARPEAEVASDVDLNESLDETLDLVSHRLHGIAIERHYGEIPLVRAHPPQLGQIWTNLLVNAADALEGTGRISVVTSSPDAQSVRVEIVDDGPGIPAELTSRIFEPRFTTKQGTVRYGMGLGLSLTRTLVERNGGTIAVSSRPGHTVFTVTLPAAQPSVTSNTEEK
ncbi:sensor histidine kinase [Tessaracoccus caeni]|uniref:sensor histidine kinase n=1 Tax=Tessaracoccus caeni TaxID=3031239 RepID=UPI0023DA4065|nr:ATP-binding protein [Tessaracoccus caeni]MDF1488957.1 ATP-binding protein [Tessaracoccus caeni]